MASYFEWKKINKKDYEEIRKAFIIAANDDELEEAFKLFYVEGYAWLKTKHIPNSLP